MGGITHAEVQRLAGDTPREAIKQRQGPGGRMLDYVDARYVMDRLDELGPGNWQDRYEDRPNGSVRCGIGINIEGEWVWKWDVGDESDIEADKGAHSGAFKRAGVKWGIARDLYGHSTSTAQRTGGPSSPARPSAPPRPQVVRDETGMVEPPWMDDPDHDVREYREKAAVIPAMMAGTAKPGDLCEEHNEAWRGDVGDLYHGPKPYHRHPDNVRKARGA
jgi:hypothetical protein